MKYLLFLLPLTSLSQNLWDESHQKRKSLLEEHLIQVEQIIGKIKGNGQLFSSKDKIKNETSDIINVEKIDRNRVVLEVKKYKGIPYQWGGSGPEAFDCSGLVQWTIKKTYGIMIPRTTSLQFKKWGKSMKKDLKNSLPGDFIYFKKRNVNQAVTHVGIYLGDNKFIHAPKTNDVVKVSDLREFKNTYKGYVSLNQIINKNFSQ